MKYKKHLLAFALVGTMLIPQAALAAGNLAVSDKITFIYPGKDSGNFYAKIENTGDAPVAVDSGKLVIFSESDEILETSDYINSYPGSLILEPGEYTYLSEFLWNSTLKNQAIGDVKFSVSSDTEGKTAEQIPCEVTYTINGSESLDNYMHVTFKNEDSQIRYGYYLTASLYDTEGNLIYVDQNRYEALGIHPDSTVTIDMYIDNDNLSYYEANHMEIGSADALVYYLPEE